MPNERLSWPMFHSTCVGLKGATNWFMFGKRSSGVIWLCSAVQINSWVSNQETYHPFFSFFPAVPKPLHRCHVHAPNPILKNEPTKCSGSVSPLDSGFGKQQKNGLGGIMYHQDKTIFFWGEDPLSPKTQKNSETRAWNRWPIGADIISKIRS